MNYFCSLDLKLELVSFLIYGCKLNIFGFRMIDRFMKIICFSPCTVKVPALNPILTVFYLVL